MAQKRNFLAAKGEAAASPKVLVTVPNMGTMRVEVARRCLFMQADERYDVEIRFPSAVPYENNLHHIVKSFMEETDCDYWLNIDADNPPMANPLNLVYFDKDIVGLPTPIWKNDEHGEWKFYRNVFDKTNGVSEYGEQEYSAKKSGKSLVQVDAIGSGCMLIARRVFEHPEMRKAPFARKTTEEGIVSVGADIAFCERARENGFEIWAHYDYPCDHYKTINLNQLYVHFRYAEKVNRQLGMMTWKQQ